MLTLKGITKDYITGDSKVEALKGVDLQFRSNEFVSILGQSGCGKTTLLNIIGGLDKYTSGDLFINGKSPKIIRTGIGIITATIRSALFFKAITLSPTRQF